MKALLIILIVLVGVLSFAVWDTEAGLNKGLYYHGRYFVARNVDGQAVIVDLELATSRKVTLAGQPLLLPEKGWSSTSDGR